MKMIDKVEQISSQNDCALVIGVNVVLTAAEIFTFCEREDDFCLQYVGKTVIIFGMDNRLLWSAAKGFRLDESASTNRFIEKFKSWKMTTQ